MPLHVAAELGHSKVMRMLIEAGANPNSRAADGSTPLYFAALKGRLHAIKVLLRAKANPLLTITTPFEARVLPLDVAVGKGHSEVVRELIQQLGVEGCGGALSGLGALQMAAAKQQVEMMSMLTSAGVVDTGDALMVAAENGREASVKFLLQQQKGKSAGQRAAYLYLRYSESGRTPILAASSFSFSSARIVRLLIYAGADTASSVVVLDSEGVEFVNETPLGSTFHFLREIHGGETDATVVVEEQAHSLEAVQRLLLRVDAVHAVSWLWANDVPSITDGAGEGSRGVEMPSAPLTSMLPILRRRAERPRMLLSALFRQSKKPGSGWGFLRPNMLAADEVANGAPWK